MLTRQEIFDKAWTGLKSQGFVKSQSESASGCAYRGDYGLRCAVGWCIPDNAYSAKFEGVAAEDVDIRKAAGIDGRDATFAAILQKQHDQSKDPSDMEELLRNFARVNKLTIPGEPS